MEETTSILETVRKMIGPSGDYDYFDTDLIVHINSMFEVLTQCGVGPEEGFHITGPDEQWDDFETEGVLLHMAKTYIQTRVRLIFDPPTSSATAEALKKVADELEWRMYIQSQELRRGA